LGNAVKYTERGFVIFTVIGKPVDENTVNLVIDVTDSGRGIQKENFDNLFTDFTQFDTAKNKNIEGSGLGLAITWNILKAMDGDIQVFSEYGEGSTFAITIPQKFRSCEKLACVQAPEEKSVIIYEHRELYASSIAATLDDLGVSREITSSFTEFRTKLAKKAYAFIFIANSLYKQYEYAMTELEDTSKIILLTDFGETPISKNSRNILAMPAHCISIANILNGFSGDYSYTEDHESLWNFIAPDARILVVDDTKTNLIVVEGLLLPYQMQVDLCKSGEEAISAVLSRHYDLIFMDHWMPEMDGVETTKQIRCLGGADSYYRSMPIIALTANAISGTQDMFIENGLNGFLAKPIDTVKLNAVLEQWIPREKRKASTSHGAASKTIQKKQEDASPGDLKIKELNVSKGIELTGGSLERYFETLNVFYCDGLEKAEQLKACLEKGNISLYTIYVHALKSAAVNIGAEELSNAAESLEAAGQRSDLDFIKAHTPRFLTALKSLSRSIHDMLLAYNEKKAGAPPDTEVLKTKLAGIKLALETLDARMMNNTLEDLLMMKLDEESAAIIQSISRNILVANYDEALALTESLLKNL